MANATGYFEQLMRILDRNRCEVVDNAGWLGPMVLGDLLGYTRQITVAQLLERDDFARRFRANEPITLSEFFYPLLQGIDSVEIRADIELGGTDQTFNNLVGRELQRSRGQAPQAVLTLPLLVGTDGVEKMGKSLGNFIAIDAPPAEQFGALMSIPDAVVGMYAQLCAGLHPGGGRAPAEAAAGGPAANQAKRVMARAVVGLYHGGLAAVQAEERFDAVFKRHEQPVDVPIHRLPAGTPCTCRRCWWTAVWPSRPVPRAVRSTAGRCGSTAGSSARGTRRRADDRGRRGALRRQAPRGPAAVLSLASRPRRRRDADDSPVRPPALDVFRRRDTRPRVI